MIDLKNLTIKKAHEHLKKGDFTVLDLANAYLKNIEEKNDELHAYLEVFDDVKEQANAAQKRFEDGSADLLTGIPIAVKDNILIQGRKASSASKILENYIASYDATAIERLKEKGVIFLGRTNMDEFAMGGSTEKSAYGATRNPHDPKRVPGGTSGGSAAAVAADLCLAALGSDTGGSIRQPASFCGVVGLKGTYGSVSRHGLMAAVSSFDQIGPLTKTVEDAEIIYNAIKGQDSYDSTSRNAPKEKSTLKKKIGVPWNFVRTDGIDPEVTKVVENAVKEFEEKGYEIVPIELPNISYSLPAYYILNFAEISSNLARFDGVKYGEVKEKSNLLETYLHTRGELLGEEVRRRIMLGTYVLSAGYYDAYYNKATIVRSLIATDFAEAFKKVDAILTPTAPSPAFLIGEKNSDPMSMYLEDIFTVTANLISIPGISLPVGKASKDGKDLPVGVQLMAQHFHEDVLFDLSKELKMVY